MSRTVAALALMVVLGCSDDDDRPPIDGPLVQVALVGPGAVTSKPEGISCGSTCSSRFPIGTRVELIASGLAGSRFTGWSGECAGTGQCVVTVDRDVLVTANFAAANAPLEVRVIGGGTVQSSPEGIVCRDRCTHEFPRGAQVELTARAELGFAFSGWSGGCIGSADCIISMDGSASVVAVFEADASTATVEIQVTGPGAVLAGAVECRDTCIIDAPLGATLRLDALPDELAELVAWSGACSASGGAPSCSLDVTGDLIVRAAFSPVSQYALTVFKDGPGTGKVQSLDGQIDCGARCTASYDAGVVVELVASPDPGSRFDGWLDCPNEDQDGDCLVDPTIVSSVTAFFGGEAPPLTVSVLGTGSVTSNPPGIDCPNVSCTAALPFGSLVTLSPFAGDRSAFWRWEGDCAGTDPLGCSLAMNAPRAVTARFGSACNQWSVSLNAAGRLSAPYDPLMDAANALTVEAWIFGVPGLTGHVAARSDELAGECAFDLEFSQGTLSFCVYSGCTANGTLDSLCASTPLADVFPQWRHVAAVFSAPSTLYLFIDGALVNVAPVQSGSFSGTLPPIGQPFYSDVRTYVASVRMASDALYSASFTPLAAPPPLDSDIFNWQMEEGAGTTLGDSSLNGIDGSITGASWSPMSPGCN